MVAFNRLLCISNGHGEDAIALRILTTLRSQVPDLELGALPLVGEGNAFLQQQIPVIAATKKLPSGGFVYMDGRQLARDVKGGLIQLTLAQLRALKHWSKQGGTVLAVGDLIPTLFAWRSGLPYGVVGTAKSAYYLRDEQGPLPGLPWYAGWAKSIYLPWERWFMSRDRCRAVIVRDELTALELAQLGLPHVYSGNPMMDGLAPTEQTHTLQAPKRNSLTVLLLPGSRAPEAYANWETLLQAAASVLHQQSSTRPVHFLAAIAPDLDITELQSTLMRLSWRPDQQHPDTHFKQIGGSLVLTPTGFSDCLHLADIAIAMAGTATEQFVGLGKPAFITPGQGPQFTPTFAQLQTRLLGPSVYLVNNPQNMGTAIARTLQDPDRLAMIHQNGLRRMGKPGAAEAIAGVLRDRLLV